MKKILLYLLLIMGLHASAQTAADAIIKGNEWYRQGNFENAEKEYEAAAKADAGSTAARYNLANTMYRRGKNTDAIQRYDQITQVEKDPLLKSKAFYNKGAILSKEKKLEESIEAYKNALRQDPTDQQARENLQKALGELKKKEPEPKKDDEKKKQQQQQQKQQPRPKMNQKEAEQRLKLLEQKEKELQQRLQKAKATGGGGGGKDW